MLNQAVATWLRLLPLRWGVGGIILAVVWSTTSAALQGIYSDPAGGQIAALLRLLIHVVLPFGVLGFVWGWTEKAHLERSIGEEQETFRKTSQRLISRQLVKSFCCGIAFGLFTNGLGLFRSFQPWDGGAASISENITAVFGFGLLGLPVGFVVGMFFKRKLERMQAEGADP